MARSGPKDHREKRDMPTVFGAVFRPGQVHQHMARVTDFGRSASFRNWKRQVRSVRFDPCRISCGSSKRVDKTPAAPR